MLENLTENSVSKQKEVLASKSPFFLKVWELVRDHPERFTVAPDREGLDIGAGNRVQGKPNRARLKVFYLTDRKAAVFFYKPSLLPFSRDRFGYGGRVFDPETIEGYEILQWLDFLAEGMSPNGRPGKLLRGFPYDVPY